MGPPVLAYGPVVALDTGVPLGLAKPVRLKSSTTLHRRMLRRSASWSRMKPVDQL
jgi:hypothetical protein